MYNREILLLGVDTALETILVSPGSSPGVDPFQFRGDISYNFLLAATSIVLDYLRLINSHYLYRNYSQLSDQS